MQSIDQDAIIVTINLFTKDSHKKKECYSNK